MCSEKDAGKYFKSLSIAKKNKTVQKANKMRLRTIKVAFRRMHTLLAAKQYDLLYAEDVNKRITAMENEEAILEYGGTVTLPPEEAYEDIWVYTHCDTDKEVSAQMYVWIDNGESDLTLSCGIGTEGDKVFFAIDDIHVL